MNSSHVRNHKTHGAILVGVLWLVLILSLLLLGLNREVQLSSTESQGQLDAVRAHWVARAGIERALAVLSEDGSAYDGPLDFWYEDPESFKSISLAEGYILNVTAPPVENAPSGTPRYGLDDEASRINLSGASRDLLARIDALDASHISPILDWVDNNEEAEPGGAERGYYQRLNLPYEVRNGPMRTIREMMLIKDITPELFYAEDTDADGVLDRREDDGGTAMPADNNDGMLDRGLNGLFTVYSYETNKTLDDQDRINLKSTDAGTLTSRFSITQPLAERIADRGKQYNSVFDMVGEKGEGDGSDEEDKTNEITMKWLAENYEQFTLVDDDRLPGRVNINTAERRVLEAIPGLTPATVQSIIDKRATDGAFTSLGELLTAGTVSEEQFKESADYLTVRSNVLTVRSTGTTPLGIHRSIVAVIDRGGDTPSILYWWQSE